MLLNIVYRASIGLWRTIEFTLLITLSKLAVGMLGDGTKLSDKLYALALAQRKTNTMRHGTRDIGGAICGNPCGMQTRKKAFRKPVIGKLLSRGRLLILRKNFRIQGTGGFFYFPRWPRIHWKCHRRIPTSPVAGADPSLVRSQTKVQDESSIQKLDVCIQITLCYTVNVTLNSSRLLRVTFLRRDNQA
jgi:hypothetical protein